MSEKQAIVEKNLGNEAYKKLNFVAAHKHYDAAIALSPNNCIFYSNKAAVFFHEGKFHECIDSCIKAIQIGRKNEADLKLIAKAMTRIGNAYLQIKNYKDALRWYKQTVAVNPDRGISQKLEHLQIQMNEEGEEENPFNWPSDIFKWIKANPNPKMALKLMKCDRYFCHQEFPYLVMQHISHYGMNTDNWGYGTLDEKFYEQKTLDAIKNAPKKFWITKALLINPGSLKFLKNLIPKIAVCEVSDLWIAGQKISFGEFKVLTSAKVKDLKISDTKIFDENGGNVHVDKILECVPNVKVVDFTSFGGIPYFASGTFTELVHKMTSSKIESFAFSTIDAFSDFEVFLKFMDKNPQISFNLTFADCLSVEQTKLLQNFVDQSIASALTRNYSKKMPFPRIYFPGQTEESRRKLSHLRFRT